MLNSKTTYFYFFTNMVYFCYKYRLRLFILQMTLLLHVHIHVVKNKYTKTYNILHIEKLFHRTYLVLNPLLQKKKVGSKSLKVCVIYCLSYVVIDPRIRRKVYQPHHCNHTIHLKSYLVGHWMTYVMMTICCQDS